MATSFYFVTKISDGSSAPSFEANSDEHAKRICIESFLRVPEDVLEDLKLCRVTGLTKEENVVVADSLLKLVSSDSRYADISPTITVLKDKIKFIYTTCFSAKSLNSVEDLLKSNSVIISFLEYNFPFLVSKENK